MASGFCSDLVVKEREGRKKGGPLLLGGSCVFVAKIPRFRRVVRFVSLWAIGDKERLGRHALLELGRCTFVLTKVKRPGRVQLRISDWGLRIVAGVG